MTTVKTTRTCAVLVSGMFPKSSPVAIDILRLMSGCNDITILHKWFKETKQSSDDFVTRTVDTGRLSLQLRLMLSCLHESLEVIQDLTARTDFTALHKFLHSDESIALLELQKIQLRKFQFTDRNWGLNESILRARHTTTFHYDAEKTQKTLDRWLRERGSKEKGYVIVQEDGEQTTYYSIADMVRAETAFGLGNINYDQNITELFTLVDHLTAFTDGIFIAYIKHNKLEQFIRDETNSATSIESQ